jgi:hypothetical protein
MVKKALVYVTPLAAERAGIRVIQVQGACSAESKLNATLVIHGCCKRERVFTESEVQSVIDAIAGLAQGYWESSGPGGPDMLSVGEIETECARIGIVPDPA